MGSSEYEYGGFIIKLLLGRNALSARLAYLTVMLALGCHTIDAFSVFLDTQLGSSKSSMPQVQIIRHGSQVHHLGMTEIPQDTSQQNIISISEVTEKILSAKESFDSSLANATTIKDAEAIRVQYLGKRGTINDAMSYMRLLPPEEKPKLGVALNEIKEQMEITVQQRKEELNTMEINRRMEDEALDVTLPGLRKSRSFGHRHPLSMTIEKAVDIFVKLGYDTVTDVEDSPEIETDYYCVEALNCPKVRVSMLAIFNILFKTPLTVVLTYFFSISRTTLPEIFKIHSI
jgi:hypothetical protein